MLYNQGETNNELEYRLEEMNENEKITKGLSFNKMLIIIFILIISVIIIAFIITVVLISKHKDDDKENNNDKSKDNYNHTFNIYYNIKTSENKMIRNSFKDGGENYIPEWGNLNNGKDYEENERDNFDLCIPYEASLDKAKYKAIILYIHGGGWQGGNKLDIMQLCKGYNSPSLMAASMAYTLLNGQYKEYNIFRIIDEITAVLKTMKKFLSNLGYDGEKLELIIAGGSAGSHLSLLYGYMIQNPPIPIRFILNNVGPVTLEPKYYLSTLPGKDALENIEPETILKAQLNGTIVLMNGTSTGMAQTSVGLIQCMNAWVGNDVNKNLDEMFIDIDKSILNETNEIYQDLLKKASYAFPLKYITKNSIPTLSLYGGKDEFLGVAHWSLLKKTFYEKGNNKITLDYFKYGTHDVFSDSTSEYGKKAEEKFHRDQKEYMEKYLESYKNNK